jgi:hypothetical protein
VFFGPSLRFSFDRREGFDVSLMLVF